MLTNLRGIYTRVHDHRALASILELTSELPGTDADAAERAATLARARLN